MKTLTTIRNLLSAVLLVAVSLSSPGQVSARSDCILEEWHDTWEGYDDCWVCFNLDCEEYVCSNGMGITCYD